MKKRYIAVAIVAVIILALIIVTIAEDGAPIEKPICGGVTPPAAVNRIIEHNPEGGQCGNGVENMPNMVSLGDDWIITYYLANTATTGEIMANGERVFEGAVAASGMPFGTELCVVFGGVEHWFVVCDRGVSGKVIDVFVDSPGKIPAHGVERGVEVWRKV